MKKLLWLALAINVVYVVIGVVKYGSQHVDAYGIWMFKARAWTGGIESLQNVLKNDKFAYSHQQYPLLLPAMMAGWAKVFGSVESFVWVYPVVYAMILAVLYRLTGSLGWTIAASYMGPLMAQGGRLHAGLADIWIALLVGLGMLCVRKKSLGWLALIVMVASQVKTEGIFLLALFWGISLPWKKKIGWMLLSSVPFLWWQWQVRVWGLPSDVGFYWPGITELARRFGVIVTLVVKEMLNWRNWYIVWIIWWLIAIQHLFALIRKSTSSTPASGVRLRASFTRILANNIVLILMSLGYLAVYLFAKLDPVAYVVASVDRIMLQLLPIWWPMLGWKNDNYRNKSRTIS